MNKSNIELAVGIATVLSGLSTIGEGAHIGAPALVKALLETSVDPMSILVGIAMSVIGCIATGYGLYTVNPWNEG